LKRQRELSIVSNMNVRPHNVLLPFQSGYDCFKVVYGRSYLLFNELIIEAVFST
jgi:hypothetical protein